MSLFESAEQLIEREPDPDRRAAMRGILRGLEQKLDALLPFEPTKTEMEREDA